MNSSRLAGHAADKHGVWADMRRKGTGWVLVSEEDLRELVRDEVRKELRHHREEMLEALRLHGTPPPKNEPDSDELLTVEQVAQTLKVIPDTVRTWIQSGALTASRPGNGTRPGSQVSCPPIGPGRICRVIPAGACITRSRHRGRNRAECGRDGWPRALIRRRADRPRAACPAPPPRVPACRASGCSRDLRGAPRRVGSVLRGEPDPLASCQLASAPIARPA